MPRRTEQSISHPTFIADLASIDRSTGRQIDWTNVSQSFVDATTGRKVLPAGLRVYSTASGKVVDADGVGAVTLLGLLETSAEEGDRTAALSGYGVILGGVVYLELLPEDLDGMDITALEAAGTGFAFENYEDSRAGSAVS